MITVNNFTIILIFQNYNDKFDILKIKFKNNLNVCAIKINFVILSIKYALH